MLQDIDKAYITGFLDNKNFVNHSKDYRIKKGVKKIRYRYRGRISSCYIYPLELIQFRYGGNLKKEGEVYVLRMSSGDTGFMLEDLYEFTNRKAYWEPIIEWHKIRQDNVNVKAWPFYEKMHDKCEQAGEAFDENSPIKLQDPVLKNAYIGGILDEDISCFISTAGTSHYLFSTFTKKNPIFLNYFKENNWEFYKRDTHIYAFDKKNNENCLERFVELARAKREFFIEALKTFKIINYGDKNVDKIKEFRNLNTNPSMKYCTGCKLYLSEASMDNDQYCLPCRQDKSQKYYQENKTEIIRKVRKWQKDNNYQSKSLSGRLRKRLKKLVKSTSLRGNSLIGCSPAEFRKHLESLWKEGMSWENYGYGSGKWVIDHIIPCATFNLENEKEAKKCFHYTNMQPLWFEENEKKGDSLPDGTKARSKIK